MVFIEANNLPPIAKLSPMLSHNIVTQAGNPPVGRDLA
jgi:hypothetical protein